MIGIKFHRLTVVSVAQRKYYYRCECECGELVEVYKYNLTSGKVKSCGCLRNDAIRKRWSGHSSVQDVPGYATWVAMRSRCNNPNDYAYKDWGGRGITVCERWDVFQNFIDDMGPRPSVKHSIDRIDNNGNYEPTNCRWSTQKEQARNTRANRMICHDGKTLCLTEWAEVTGIGMTTIRERLKRGWSVQRSLEELP